MFLDSETFSQPWIKLYCKNYTFMNVQVYSKSSLKELFPALYIRGQLFKAGLALTLG